MSLENTTLYYNWSLTDTKFSNPSNYSYEGDREFDMEREMSTLIQRTLDSKPLTDLSLDLIQAFNENYSSTFNDILDKNKKEEIAKLLWKFYESNKLSYNNQKIDGKCLSRNKEEK